MAEDYLPDPGAGLSELRVGEAGSAIAIVAARLARARSSTILNVYAHVVLGSDRDAAIGYDPSLPVVLKIASLFGISIEFAFISHHDEPKQRVQPQP